MTYYSALALALALAMTASMQAHAKDTAATEKVWTISAELGAITTSGNTAGTSATGKINAQQELEQWSNQYIVSAFFKEDEKTDDNGDTFSEKSAQRYMFSAKTAYKLDDEFDRLFAFGSYTDDEFGAYTEYTTVAVGYGTRLYNDDDKSLDTEIGPGYFTGKRSSGETERGFIIRGAASFNWTISESATFGQTLSVEYGSDNTRTIAETSLQSNINGSLQMKAAFLLQNDSDVPVGKKSTDTQTSVTLVYSF
jgi:putative salt-induced outer membrane protein